MSITTIVSAPSTDELCCRERASHQCKSLRWSITRRTYFGNRYADDATDSDVTAVRP
jgi:hypothetical protein